MNITLMRERMAEASPRFKVRITGAVYLLYFLTAGCGAFLNKGLVVSGDATATANNILAHESSFRLGLAIGLVATMCYIAVTALFYRMFKSVSKNLSLIAAFFSLVGCAIQAFSSVFQLAPLVVLGGNQYLSVFKAGELRALALMFFQLYAQVTTISLVFFGVYCLVIGYLIFRSAFLPRILGVLMAFAGLGWLSFLSPPLGNSLIPYNEVLGGLAEISLMLWLLVKGVNVQRWEEQVNTAASTHS
jgi:hypothetical protein